MTGYPNRVSFIRGQTNALPSITRGRSPVPKLGSPGSVRGALSNERPYRDLTARVPLGRRRKMRRSTTAALSERGYILAAASTIAMFVDADPEARAAERAAPRVCLSLVML